MNKPGDRIHSPSLARCPASRTDNVPVFLVIVPVFLLHRTRVAVIVPLVPCMPFSQFGLLPGHNHRLGKSKGRFSLNHPFTLFCLRSHSERQAKLWKTCLFFIRARASAGMSVNRLPQLSHTRATRTLGCVMGPPPYDQFRCKPGTAGEVFVS